MKTLFCWSSGKDSTFAFMRCRRRGIKVSALMTQINPFNGRVEAHNISRELLYCQSENLRLPLYLFYETFSPSRKYGVARNIAYKLLMSEYGIKRIIFGDIAERTVKRQREKYFRRLGMRAMFPVWSGKSRSRAIEIIKSGIKAVVISVDSKVISSKFLGRNYDEDFIRDLPASVDPCGENGEFHTFCYEAPIFKSPIDFRLTRKKRSKQYVYYDAVPC